MHEFTYEYVTIHLITDNAEMEEVLEPLLEVCGGEADRSLQRLELTSTRKRRLGLEEKIEHEKPIFVGK